MAKEKEMPNGMFKNKYTGKDLREMYSKNRMEFFYLFNESARQVFADMSDTMKEKVKEKGVMMVPTAVAKGLIRALAGDEDEHVQSGAETLSDALDMVSVDIDGKIVPEIIDKYKENVSAIGLAQMLVKLIKLSDIGDDDEDEEDEDEEADD